MYYNRPYYDAADHQRVLELARRIVLSTGLESLGFTEEDLHFILSRPAVVIERDLHIWEDNSQKLVGFIFLVPQPPRERFHMFGGLRIDPQADPGLIHEILAWAEKQTSELSSMQNLPPQISIQLDQQLTEQQQQLEMRSYTLAETKTTMVRVLEDVIPLSAWPDGVKLGVGIAQDDYTAWRAFIFEIFPDAKAMGDTFPCPLDMPGYRPNLDLGAIGPDGSLVGTCMGEITQDALGKPIGFISAVSVLPAFRHQGVAHALLLEMLRRLQEEGITKAQLIVVSNNPTGAVEVFTSVGFVPESTVLTWQKDL